MRVFKVFKYAIPVDGEDHAVEMGNGPIWHVASLIPSDLLHAMSSFSRGTIRYVNFWAQSPTEPCRRVFRVFGTGFDIPDGYEYRGTAITAEGALVWHLFERLGAGS